MISKLPNQSELLIYLTKTDLNGSMGNNREQQYKCQIQAANDLEAVHCWLNRYAHKPTTYKNYKKEAERLLLWCVCIKKKPLSSLDIHDFELFFDFLQNPPPEWCSHGRKCHRDDPAWRPIVKPFTGGTLNTTITILKSLMSFLFRARYLTFNPLSLLRNSKYTMDLKHHNAISFERILQQDEWEIFKQTLSELAKTKRNARLRLIVAMLFLLGLRINELATHTWNSFQKHNNKFWFYVQGKGNKIGKIPVNQALLNEIKLYEQVLGMSELQILKEHKPIISSIYSNNPLSSRQIYRLLKDFASIVSKKFDNSHQQAKMKKFSPHWLRHLSATLQDNAGISFKHIQSNHRHQSEHTTRRYMHSYDLERHADMEKLLFIEN